MFILYFKIELSSVLTSLYLVHIQQTHNALGIFPVIPMAENNVMIYRFFCPTTHSNSTY